MLVATLDLSKAHATEATRRHNHPVFKPYWDLGRRILSGEAANVATAGAVRFASGRDHDGRRPDGLFPRRLRQPRTHDAAHRRGRRQSRGCRGLSRNWPSPAQLPDDITRADATVLHDALARSSIGGAETQNHRCLRNASRRGRQTLELGVRGGTRGQSAHSLRPDGRGSSGPVRGRRRVRSPCGSGSKECRLSSPSGPMRDGTRSGSWRRCAERNCSSTSPMMGIHPRRPRCDARSSGSSLRRSARSAPLSTRRIPRASHARASQPTEAPASGRISMDTGRSRRATSKSSPNTPPAASCQPGAGRRSSTRSGPCRSRIHTSGDL